MLSVCVNNIKVIDSQVSKLQIVDSLYLADQQNKGYHTLRMQFLCELQMYARDGVNVSLGVGTQIWFGWGVCCPNLETHTHKGHFAKKGTI